MTFADEGEFAAFIGRDNLLPMVTSGAVAKALEGFPLTLVPGKDMDWLAMAVRRSLAISIPDPSDGPKRTSNAEIRAELERLADLLESTWLELFQCDPAAEERLFDFGWNWDGSGRMDDPSDYNRFKAAISELDWLASFMRDAAKATPSQRGPWRQSEERQLRVERGQCLAPIFEAAFGQPVTANNWKADGWRGDPYSKSKTAFMDFYQRMVALAFQERGTPDLSGVLKAACRLHRQDPAQFAEDIIPGL